MPPAKPPATTTANATPGLSRAWIATFTALVAALLTWLAPSIWTVIPLEGVLAAGVILAATGWGAWPAVWLGGPRRPALQQVCLAVAIGLGVLAAATLVLGAAGLLSRWVAWGLLIAGWVLGAIRIRDPNRRPAPEAPPRMTPAGYRWSSLLLLTLAAPLAIGLFGASLPPGILWGGENYGYDVLEYHLQAPREYYDAGTIHFLPHNVYASFPQQMEVLYLLLMHVADGTTRGALPAQFLHLFCGVLAVVALGAWLPAGWPRRIATVAAGTVPFVAYLGCLAYVEAGMLLFTAVAAGLTLELLRGAGSWRIALGAGICAGLAGSCKYTALVFVGVALGVALLITLRGGLGHRLRLVTLIGLGTLIGVSPWLTRNAAFTGNPVYPFAYSVFGGAAWSPEQAAQWDHGHRLPEDQRSLGGRTINVVNNLLLEPGYGTTLFLLAGIGVVATLQRHAQRRDTRAAVANNRPGHASGIADDEVPPRAEPDRRAAMLLLTWAVLIVLSWMFLTHMPGRFAVPIVVPLVLLAGFGAYGVHGRMPTLVCVIAAAGALIGGGMLGREVWRHDQHWRGFGWPLAELVGYPSVLEAAYHVNRAVPPEPGVRVWLVGEARVFYMQRPVHYTVVFGRDPWLTYAETAPPADAVDWLRTQNATHLLFSWGEIDRLRTYGFPEFVTPTWAGRLADAGLRRIWPSPAEATAQPDVEIYEITPPVRGDSE